MMNIYSFNAGVGQQVPQFIGNNNIVNNIPLGSVCLAPTAIPIFQQTNVLPTPTQQLINQAGGGLAIY
jgi:hypothetical protein